MVSAYAHGPWAAADGEVAGEVVERGAGLAGDVVGEAVDHSRRCAARSAGVVVDEDVGEVVPVLGRAASVGGVGLGEEVAGEAGDAQLDVDGSVGPGAVSGRSCQSRVAKPVPRRLTAPSCSQPSKLTVTSLGTSSRSARNSALTTSPGAL